MSIDGHSKEPPNSNSTGTFLSFDSFLENISPAALPTMLMSKLINMTGASQNPTTEQQSATEETNELVPDDDSSTGKEPSSLLHRLSLASPLDKKKNETSSSSSDSLANRIKRRSLFFNWSTGNIESPTQVKNSADDLQDVPQDDTDMEPQEQKSSDDNQVVIANKTRPASTSYSFTKIPRAVSGAIKTQVLRTDNNNTSSLENEENKQLDNTLEKNNEVHQRNRGSSLSNIRHHMSPAYLYNKINNTHSSTKALSRPISNDTTVNDSTADISIIHQDEQKDKPPKRNRARTVGSIIMHSTRNILAPGSNDIYYNQQHINEAQHRHPKGPMWLNEKMLNALNEELSQNNDDDEEEDDSDDQEDLANLTKDYYSSLNDVHPELKQKEQEAMNDHLNANFPMLLKTESVDAGKELQVISENL